VPRINPSLAAPALAAIAAPLALVLTLAACQQKTGDAGNPEPTTSAAAPDAKPGSSLSEGRLVLPAVGGNPGAAYFTLTNAGKAPVSIAAIAVTGAARAEMHQTSGGAMRAVSKADVAPGASLKFEPGSSHVMLFDLDPKLAAGGTTELTVTFADGDKISAPLTIEAAGGMGAMHDANEMDGHAMHGGDHH